MFESKEAIQIQEYIDPIFLAAVLQEIKKGTSTTEIINVLKVFPKDSFNQFKEKNLVSDQDLLDLTWEEIKSLTLQKINMLEVSSFLFWKKIVSWKTFLKLPDTVLTLPLVACIGYAVEKQKIPFETAFDLVVKSFAPFDPFDAKVIKNTFKIENTINTTNHVKIWFSKNPNEMFGYAVNRYRLMKFRLKNPHRGLLILVDLSLLSETARRKLTKFALDYNIDVQDITDLEPKLNNFEKALFQKGRIENTNPNGKVVVFSDILRWFVLDKIYTDFDVEVKFRNIKKEIKTKENFLIPYDIYGKPNNNLLIFPNPDHLLVKCMQAGIFWNYCHASSFEGYADIWEKRKIQNNNKDKHDEFKEVADFSGPYLLHYMVHFYFSTSSETYLRSAFNEVSTSNSKKILVGGSSYKNVFDKDEFFIQHDNSWTEEGKNSLKTIDDLIKSLEKKIDEGYEEKVALQIKEKLALNIHIIINQKSHLESTFNIKIAELSRLNSGELSVQMCKTVIQRAWSKKQKEYQDLEKKFEIFNFQTILNHFILQLTQIFEKILIKNINSILRIFLPYAAGKIISDIEREYKALSGELEIDLLYITAFDNTFKKHLPSYQRLEMEGVQFLKYKQLEFRTEEGEKFTIPYCEKTSIQKIKQCAAKIIGAQDADDVCLKHKGATIWPASHNSYSASFMKDEHCDDCINIKGGTNKICVNLFDLDVQLIQLFQNEMNPDHFYNTLVQLGEKYQDIYPLLKYDRTFRCHYFLVNKLKKLLDKIKQWKDFSYIVGSGYHQQEKETAEFIKILVKEMTYLENNHSHILHMNIVLSYVRLCAKELPFFQARGKVYFYYEDSTRNINLDWNQIVVFSELETLGAFKKRARTYISRNLSSHFLDQNIKISEKIPNFSIYFICEDNDLILSGYRDDDLMSDLFKDENDRLVFYVGDKEIGKEREVLEKRYCIEKTSNKNQPYATKSHKNSIFNFKKRSLNKVEVYFYYEDSAENLNLNWKQNVVFSELETWDEFQNRVRTTYVKGALPDKNIKIPDLSVYLIDRDNDCLIPSGYHNDDLIKTLFYKSQDEQFVFYVGDKKSMSLEALAEKSMVFREKLNFDCLNK